MKLELLTNATVVDDAMRFVSEQGKEKLKSSSSNANISKEDNQDAKLHNDNDELLKDKDEENGEMMTTTRTTNQVF